MKVMLIDDEPAIRALVRRVLEGVGYEYCEAATCAEAHAVLDTENPDMLILDVMLPDGDGFRLCRELRDSGVVAPILFLTAKGDITDKGIGFRSGGDDYLTKPFSLQELVLRVEAHLRTLKRLGANATSIIRAGRLEIDVERQTIRKNGGKIELTPREYKILALLASNPGVVLTKEQIVSTVWGKEFVGETTSLAVFIRKLREKIEEDPSNPQLIQTVWRIGYQFVAELKDEAR